MGIFHCVPDGCAEVRYQPYQKTGGIRYRFPGEEWVKVDGDDYSVSQETGQCPGKPYAFGFNVEIIDPQGNPAPFNDQFRDSEPCIINSNATGGYIGLVQSIPYPHKVYLSHPYPTGALRYFRANIDFIDRWGNPKTAYTTPPSNINGFKPGSVKNECVNFASLDDYGSSDNCGQCLFRIFKNGEITLEIKRDICPEVEQEEIGCELSDRYEVIKIEKTPYLQRIEVRNQDIRGYGVGGTLIDTSPLPEESLNIYLTLTTAPPFPNDTVPTAAIFNPYQFVAQISSEPGCPPPEYNVVCRCGEECPVGTCPVFCGDHVCCHDPNTGVSVYQIPLGEYSGGGL